MLKILISTLIISTSLVLHAKESEAFNSIVSASPVSQTEESKKFKKDALWCLSNIYTAQKATHAEYKTYSESLDAIGVQSCKSGFKIEMRASKHGFVAEIRLKEKLRAAINHHKAIEFY